MSAIFTQTQNNQRTLSVFKRAFIALMFCSILTSSFDLFAEEETPETDTSEETSNEEVSEEANDEEIQPVIVLTTQDWKDLKRPKANSDMQREQLLKQASDPRQVIEFETPSETFFGLYLERNTAQPIGAALILHDAGLNADEPSFVSPLRNNLTDYGWSTLTISIPDPESTPLPERQWPPYPADFTLNPPEEEEEVTEEESDNAETAEETTEEDTTAPANQPEENTEQTAADDTTENDGAETANEPEITKQERTMQRIEAALQDLQGRGLLNIAIIGHGVSASWAISYLGSTNSPEMFTLVILDPRLPDAETDMDYLNTKIQGFDTMPVLDLITSQTVGSAKSAKERKDTATRNQVSNYLQLKASPVTENNAQHHRLVKRVRGWLAQNAPGEETKIR